MSKHVNGTTETNRAAINRENSKHSTGPVTPEGKARSSQNALKHGMTAKAIVLPGEDPGAYQRHVDSFMDQFKTDNPAELAQVQNLADTSWHQARIGRPETILFSQFDEHKSLDSQMRALSAISMHRHRLSRDFDRTLKELKQAQQDRINQHHVHLDKATLLYSLDEDQGIEYDPSVDGFVFSKKEVETLKLRKQRLYAAVQHDLYPDDGENGEEEEENT